MTSSNGNGQVFAAIYARKSTAQTDRDDLDKSVARQIANARGFAESRGWRVLEDHVYADDGISGGLELHKLPAKKRLVDLIHSGKAPFQVVVTQAPDRFSRRDGDEAFSELKAISRAGIAVWFYADGAKFEYGSFAANVNGFLKAELAAEFVAVFLRRRARRCDARPNSATSSAA